MSDWQPIETAPKDEVLIMVAWPNPNFPGGWGMDVWAADVLHETLRKSNDGAFRNAPHLDLRPTHWRLVPSPPGYAA